MAPILQVFLLGYAATTDVSSIDLVVCDMDRSRESRELVQQVVSSEYFVHRFSCDQSSEIDGYLEQGGASAALVIPRGFGRKLLAREPALISVIIDGSNASTATITLGYISQIIGSSSRKFIIEFARATEVGICVPTVIAEPRVWFNPDLKSSHFMVPGVVALVLMIITMTLTALGIVKERESGTLEQIMVTPIRPHELILGKLVPFIIIGFVDVLIVLAIARFWFEVPLVGNLWLLFGLSGLFILTTLGLGLFISTIARTQQQAMLIAQFFFFMPFMFLSGFAFPISNMPQIIQLVTYLIPLRYFLEIIRGVFLKGSTLADLWMQSAALAVFGVVILTLSVMRFRQKLV
jgi:ABC-2 type transport system permease protein